MPALARESLHRLSGAPPTAVFYTKFASQKLEVGTSVIEARVTLPDDQSVRKMVGLKSFV